VVHGRVGYLETARAVGRAGSPSAVRAVQREWAAFNVIKVDQDLVERATELALAHDLRSLDALRLASALVLPPEDLTVAVWDPGGAGLSQSGGHDGCNDGRHSRGTGS
jgi:hypothetical protein